MYEDYEEQGFSVVAFPCNQFGGQEPGTNEEIKAHVEEKYGITFDMMSKIDVNGSSKLHYIGILTNKYYNPSLRSTSNL